MDFNKQNSLKEQSNTDEAEDRFSKLTDSLVHHILSFNDTKTVAQTSVLSKRWNHIWTSIPTLYLQFWELYDPPSWEVEKFMDFVDRTLLLHYATNILNFTLRLFHDMNASRVHSWIEYIARRNVEAFCLHLDRDISLSLPLSLFTCASLKKLDLSTGPRVRFPKTIFLPNLKSLTLWSIQFSDGCWNGQLFSNCPVLEELVFDCCTWFGVRKFSILTPVLKILQIENDFDEDGLNDCEFKIHAPNLLSLIYSGCAAKDYDMSSFLTLDKEDVKFHKYEQSRRGKQSVSKFLQALSHDLSVPYDFVNHLPTFHNLNELNLLHGVATDKLILALLKEAPNLKKLLFDESALSSNKNEKESYDETKDLFPHLQSVCFGEFSGKARELRWVKLILKNANSLQKVTFQSVRQNSIEVLMSKLPSLPRASGKCLVEVGGKVIMELSNL